MDHLRIKYMKEWISQLPKGNITYKTIRGKKYAYLQWTQDGKQRSRRVKDDEYLDLSVKIEERKALERKVKEATALLKDKSILEDTYFCEIKKGSELLDFAEPVRTYKKRDCFSKIQDYIYGDSSDRVLILCGLRRTGKTTLIRQSILEMPKEMLEKTAFIQVLPTIDLPKINLDLRQLKKQGIKVVFIDEVTLMDDFIEGAALFSDVYASSGMKIVLSGTDSLGFMLSEDHELFDRCDMIRTTFVPYREFEEVLGMKGIDEYIRFGGTMSLSGVNYNHSRGLFSSRKGVSDYVDSAIAHNIQHSLKNYRGGSHFSHLRELVESDECTSVINRIVEDINHRFALYVLTKDFKSNDLSLSAKNLLKDKQESNTILYQIDQNEVTEKLRQLLEIKNKNEQMIELQEVHQKEIKQYLELLDITVDVDVVSLTDLNLKEKRSIITQPGLRYAQAKALIQSLMEDQTFTMYSLDERNKVIRRIMSDILGRMMEDHVLLETKIAYPHCEVFKLMFARGEFDMVVFNPETASCSIYEIKHSSERCSEQIHHLIDQDKCKKTEFRYGPITEKVVIYRGENGFEGDVRYMNVEEYLLGLKGSG